MARAGSHVYFMSIAKPPNGQGKWVTMSGLDNSSGGRMDNGESTTILDTVSGNIGSQTRSFFGFRQIRELSASY